MTVVFYEEDIIFTLLFMCYVLCVMCYVLVIQSKQASKRGT
jgi:glycopeptide antibiotics resistance protein